MRDMDGEIPQFYRNLPDEAHCVQACSLMVLNTLGIQMTWDEINQLTESKKGFVTWMVHGAAVIADRIPGTKIITDNFDYELFSKEGRPYLRRIWSERLYERQRASNSSRFRRERRIIANFLQSGHVENIDEITKEQMENYCRENFIIAQVDPIMLEEQRGSTARHAIVLYDQDEKHFILHDPGFPPIEGMIVDKDIFMDAFMGEAIVIPRRITS